MTLHIPTVRPAPEPATGLELTAADAAELVDRWAEGVAARSHLGDRVAGLDQVIELRLVGNRRPQAADVLGRQALLQEALQRRGRQLQRHHHRIDAVLLEQVVVDLGRAHLRDGVAKDEVDAGGSGDGHGRTRRHGHGVDGA